MQEIQTSQPSDVLSLFDAIKEKAKSEILLKRPNSIILPEGNTDSGSIGVDATHHQQSIQKTSSGGFIVTGSAKELGYVYFTDNNNKIIQIKTPGYIDFQGKSYNHFGGCQITNGILAFGIERIKGDNTSNILFFNANDVCTPELPNLRILRGDSSSKSKKDSYTAGAVGLTKTKEGWILAVANYNAVRIDFYTCSKSDLTTIVCREMGFNFLKSWYPQKNNYGGNAYQNINLFTQLKDGIESLWMVGMYSGSSPSFDDMADLFLIDLDNDKYLKKRSKHFTRLTTGPRFLYGSGFYYDYTSNIFKVYDCEANLSGSNADTCRCNKWE